MKTKLPLIFILLINMNVYSQIPNVGFENWNGSIPVDWFSSGGPGYVSQDLNAHSGIYAAHFQTLSGSSGVTNSTFAARTVNNTPYFPVGSVTAPALVSFWAITNFMGDDVLNVNVTFKQGTNIVGVINQQCVMTSSTTYQQYSFPILYNPPNAVPDSVAMWFTIHEGGCATFSNLVRAGTFAIIDDIGYTISTSNDDLTTAFGIEIFPNPIEGVIRIKCNSDSKGMCELNLRDINGREVTQSYVQPSHEASSVNLDLSDLTPGIYFLQVKNDDWIGIKKIVLTGKGEF